MVNDVTLDSREVLIRPAPPPDVVLRYGGHADHVIDLRLPREQTGPLVVFLHGGFWRAEFDRSHTGPLAAALAAKGYPVACVEFRRVGTAGGGWPGTFDDVERALAAIPDLVRPYADPTRPVLAGHSAGGHLALVYAGLVAGVLALAPVADLAEAYRLRLGEGAVAELLGGGPERVPARYDRVDPVRRGLPPVPVVIVHGDADDRVPVAISQRYVSLVSPRCQLFVLPGGGHFGVIDPLSSAWPTVLMALAQLVDVHGKRR